MMIDICSHASARGLVVTEPSLWDLILITNTFFEPEPEHYTDARRMLRLAFDDISGPVDGLKEPTTDNVEQALAWSSSSERLVVACHAGVSRSSALAYVIGCRHWPPAQAIEILEPLRHSPNERIVRLGSVVLQCPEVFDTFQRWRGGGRA